MNYKETLKGIFPPITTPFQNDELALDKLAENINKYNQTDLTGYVVFGSNGESVFLTSEEKLILISSVKEQANSNKKIIAGTGLESIKDTIFLTNNAAKMGADFALIITPSFYKSVMNHNAFITYYTTIADSISIPLIIYNVTKFTNVNITSETIAELAQHPNIIGIKDSTENIAQISETINLTPDDFVVLIGTGSVLLPGLNSGAKGGVLALANIAPNECLQIYNLFSEGRLEEAKEIQNRLIPVNKAITVKYGVAGLKTAMDMIDYYGGLPRKPLQELSLKDKEDLKIILEKANLLIHSQFGS